MEQGVTPRGQSSKINGLRRSHRPDAENSKTSVLSARSGSAASVRMFWRQAHRQARYSMISKPTAQQQRTRRKFSMVSPRLGAFAFSFHGGLPANLRATGFRPPV